MSKKLSLLQRSSTLFLAAVVSAWAPLVAAAQLTVGAERAVSTADLETSARGGVIDSASDGSTVLAVWTDRRTDRSTEIFAARLDRTGKLYEASIALTATPFVGEDHPFVEYDGSRFVAVWYDGANSVAAEVDANGAITNGPTVLAPGIPTSLVRAGRNLVVAITDSGGTTLSIIGSSLTLTEAARVKPTVNVSVATLENGFMVFWNEDANSTIVRALRLDNRGRVAATFNLGDLGTFGREISIAVSTLDNVAIVAVADRQRMVVARVTNSGGVTILTTITALANRTIEDIIPRTGGFDVVTIINGRPRVFRYTSDALTTEFEPLAGPAQDGAAAYVNGRLFTLWQIEGAVTGRFAFLPQEPLVPISRSVQSQQMPALGSDGTNVLSVWTEDVTENRDRIMARLMTKNGTAISDKALTVATRTMTPLSSAPAVTFTSNHYYVAWVDARNGPEKPAVLTMRVVEPNGALAGDISVSSTVDPLDSPALAAGNGDGLLVWAKAAPSPRIRASFVSNPSSNQFDFDNMVREPAVVFGNGAYIVVGGTPGAGITAARVSTTGTIEETLFETIPPPDMIDSEPAIAWNGSNRYLVVFRRGPSIFGRFLDASGRPSGADFSIATPLASDNPAVTWNGDAFVVSWTERPDDDSHTDGEVLITRVLPDGTVEPATGLSATARNDDYPALLGIGGGNTLAAYQRMAPDLQHVHRVFTRVVSTTPPEPVGPRKRRSVR